MSDDGESSSERESLRLEDGGAADNLQQPAAPAPDSSAVAASASMRQMDKPVQSLGEALREARGPRGAALADSGSLSKLPHKRAPKRTQAHKSIWRSA